MKNLIVIVSLLSGFSLTAAANTKKIPDTSNIDVNSSDKRSSKYWRFTGDGKTSPISGVKFQKTGYSCKAKRVSPDGKLIGKEVSIESTRQVTVGAILKKVEIGLNLPRTYDENSGNIKNIGTSLPVYQVLSKDGDKDYLAVCAIWLSGKVLYLGNPENKK